MMLFLVENCFHWIGFHIINYLLEDGYQVHGVDEISTDKKEHLSMYVGRNESFQHFSALERDTDYDTSMKIDNNEIIITHQQNKSLRVKLPLLFGEWMPMESNGIYYKNELISFDSDVFIREGVFIEDFIKSLMQWVNSSQLPSFIDVKSIKNRRDENVRLENFIYIRNNRPTEENVKIVINHYKKFNEYY